MQLNFNQNQSGPGMERFLKFLIVILLSLATFLGGHIWNEKSLESQQATVLNNLLTSRFDEPSGVKRGPLLKLNRLTSEEAAFAVLSKDKKIVIYYAPETGQLRSVTVDGIDSPKTIATLTSFINKISWSSDLQKLVSVHNGQGSYINLETGKTKIFSPLVQGPVFSPFDQKIAYIHFDDQEKKGSINLADPAIEGFKKLLLTRSPNWTMHWLNDERLVLAKPANNDFRKIALFTLETISGNMNSLLGFLDNLEFKISPSGEKILYSYDNGNGNGLYYLEMSNKKEVGLDFNTRASKCAWDIDNETVYCAKDGQEGDEFHVINVKTRESNKIFSPEYDVDASELMMMPGENYLIFKNLNNNKLYSLFID